MKKFRNIIFLALAMLVLLGFTSCKDVEESSFPPNSNDNLEQFEPIGDSNDNISGNDTFVFEYNTYINGIDISGKTVDDARKLLSELETDLMADYTCKLYLDDMQFFLSSSDISIAVNLNETLQNAMKGHGNYSLVFSPEDDERLDAALTNISNAVNIKPTPDSLALIKNEGAGSKFKIEHGHNGLELDKQSTKQLILSGEHDIRLPMIETAPCLNEISLPILRGSCKTEFSIWNKDRAYNVSKAASIINGKQLLQNEELSFDDCLGSRSKENGWKKAEAFTNGGLDSEDQYGGGICQVSSTLYNAALCADLEIPLRCNHSKPVPYLPAGLDAAISEGSMDLIIRNSTGNSIYIFMWVEDGYLFCEIYGEKFDDSFDKIELVSEYLDIIPPGEPKFYDDYELAYGETRLVSPAVYGSIYETFKIYYKDSIAIKRVRVGESKYKSHAAIYAIGKQRQQ